MDATEEEKKKVCTEDDRKPGSALVVCPCSPEDRWSEKPVFRFCLMDGDGSWMDSKLADISVFLFSQLEQRRHSVCSDRLKESLNIIFCLQSAKIYLLLGGGVDSAE